MYHLQYLFQFLSGVLVKQLVCRKVVPTTNNIIIIIIIIIIMN